MAEPMRIELQGRVTIMPAWKSVACPYCGAKPGDSCGRWDSGGTHWVRTAPHAWRKQEAAKGQPGTTCDVREVRE